VAVFVPQAKKRLAGSNMSKALAVKQETPAMNGQPAKALPATWILFGSLTFRSIF